MRNERGDRHRRDNRPPRRVAVLGAGIAGLVAAWEVAKAGGEPVVLEAAPRIGGKVRTESLEGVVVEAGPDSFLTAKPEMLELVRELGLEGELIGTGPDASVSLFADGRLLRLPDGIGLAAPTKLLPFLFTPALSWRAKLAMALEPLKPPRREGGDESLAAFTRRRLGDEALRRLVGPMLAGIYAGDPERLSVRSTFPQLAEMERKGGLARGLWTGGPRRARTPGVTAFMTLKGGLERAVEALARKLPPRAVRADCPAQVLKRKDAGWEILTPKGPVEADAVVSALPAPALADVLEGLDPELAMRLREIPFASTAVMSLLYGADAFPRPPRGFGFLSARDAGLTVNAATFATAKFPARAVPGAFVARCFVGGVGREGDAEGSITRLEERVRADLERVLGAKAEPRAWKTTRWIKANPQYEVGHGRRLERLTSCLRSHPGLVLAGASYGGVGLPDCVRSGRRAARLALAPPRRNNDDPASGLA